jgi:hypothetical protein
MKQYMKLMLAVWVLGATAMVVAQADQQVLKLTGAAETPAVTTKASGVATLVVKADGTVSGGVTTTGFDGTAAHIHQGAAGASGPPIITLQRAGSDQWLVPDGSKLTAGQYAAFKQGDLYVNVHSKAHPGGEIRAQLEAPREAKSP